jgi:O-antigen ligase
VSFAMLPVWVYLTALMIAPQLWIEPFVGLRPDLAIYATWMVVLAIRGRFVDVFRFKLQDWFFVGMLIWILLSMLVNGFRGNSETLLTDYIKFFLVYRFTAASIDSVDNLRRAVWIFLFFGLLLAVEGIQHMQSEDGLGWAGQSFAWIDPSAKTMGIQNRTRWINIFDGPGVFCVIYTIALPYAMQYMGAPYSVLARLFAVSALIPLLVLGTYYTGSRGGILTALAIVGLFTLSKFRLSVKKLVLIIGIGAAGMMLGPAYLTSTSDSSGSAQHRVEMWGEGVEMVTYNPVFGIGKGNFLSYTHLLIAHNSAVEVMGETGLPGLFFWFGILYLGIKNLVQRYGETDDGRERALLMAVGLSTVGYYVSSLFVTLEYETLYCMLGLTAAVSNWTKDPKPYTGRDFWIMSAIMLFYVVLIKAFVMAYF